MLRVLDRESVLVVLNTSNEARTMRVPYGLKVWKDYRLDDLITERLAKPPGDDAPIELEPFGVRVLRIRGNQRQDLA